MSGDPAAAFDRLKTLAAAMPRTTILSGTPDRFRAACRTRLGFVDDLECCLCESEGVIHVRSASRAGYYDFGANRARIKALRRLFESGE